MPYTSYYGNLSNIPKDIKIVSISRTMPKGIQAIRDYTVDKYANKLLEDDIIVSSTNYENMTNRFTIIEHEKSSNYSKIILAPTSAIFTEYQANHDKEAYKTRYYKDVLNKLDLEAVNDYYGDNTVYTCYDYPTDFCHRHYLRECFNSIGINCTELPYNDSDDIRIFRDNYYFLSNMFPCEMCKDGLKFTCLESVYQSMKTNDLIVKEAFTEVDGFKAKNMGYSIELPDNWNKIKFNIMFELLLYKFKMPAFREALLNTGSRNIIHENDHGDKYWGIFEGEGENILGKLLMQIREMLR